jgi:hypothetical protein
LLLLADISGYTRFLDQVADAHRDDAFAGGRVPDAYALVSSLLDGIVDRLCPPLELSKIEGDAVFAFATAGREPALGGGTLLERLRSCYASFRAQLADAESVWTCRCDACARVDALDLKFVVHAGGFIVQSIAGTRELAGPDVVLVHRLLKNGAAQLIGSSAYVLLTEAATGVLSIPMDLGRVSVEDGSHGVPVAIRIVPLR